MSSLSTYQDIRTHFKNMCLQSRYQLRQQLINKTTEDQPLEQELAKAFQILYSGTNANNSAIQNKIKDLFGIQDYLLKQMNPKQRKIYVNTCIKQSINEELSEIKERKAIESTQRQSYKQFSWLDLNTKYEYLKPMFQEILLEKIRWFDQQLTETLNSNNTYNIPVIKTTESFEIDSRETAVQWHKNCHSSLCKTKFCQISNRKIKLNKDRFQKVAVRNQSKFLKTEWTKFDEEEFIDKKRQLIGKFKKGSKIPIIYQFVKKYTETNKGRDLLLKKWQRNEKISDQQLRYLCATSVFLNQSINKSEKRFIGQKLDKLNKTLISQLQANIAQKIIETYKQFMGKVSSIRSNYYLKTSLITKKQLEEKSKLAIVQSKNKQKYQQFLGYKKMFLNICNSKHLSWKLNHKVSRWVYYFIDKLKDKCKITKKRGKSLIVKRLTASKSTRMIQLKKRVQGRSTKFFKPVIKKRHLITQQNSFEEANPETSRKLIKSTTKQNKTQQTSRSKFFNPPRTPSVTRYILEPYSHYIVYPKSIIPNILKIQSTWRMYITKKAFKTRLVSFRHFRQGELQKQILKLRLIYPPYTKINYSLVLKRINRLDMLRQFIKLTQTKIINHTIRKKLEIKFLYFSQQQKTQLQLYNIYRTQTPVKRKHNFQRLVHYCNFNMFDKLMHSNMVFSEADLNGLVDGKCPLCCCTKNRNHRLMMMLLQGGVNPNLCDMSKQTPLHYAFKLRDFKAIFMLIDFKADLNLTDECGNTPLFYASKEILKQLGLQNGIVTNNYLDKNSLLVDNNELYRKSHTKNLDNYT